jgi:hypothetical protein
MTTRGERPTIEVLTVKGLEGSCLDLFLDGTEKWESGMEDAIEKNGMLIRYAPVGKLSVCLAVCLVVVGSVGAGIIIAAG